MRTEYLFLIILFFGSFYLRFKSLGYSDYIGDEHKAFIELTEGQTVWEFFMEQRKGPMQFLVSYIPYLFTHDYRNEFAQRIPFSLISVASVLVFYFLVKKLTKKKEVAFISAFLFMVNGFIVGFGRIAQYQNLNLLFSLLSLYFYANLLSDEKNLFRSSFFGTLFWCLSILSHWDAIFIIPVVSIIFIRFLSRKDLEVKDKKLVFIFNFIFGCFLLLPFLIPYARYQVYSPENSEYFGRRIEIGHSLNERYKLLIELYNPFLTFWFLVVSGSLGVLFFKKSYIYVVWFLFSYGVFEMFVRKPGTHIYNFLIPVFILSGIGIYEVANIIPKFLRGVLTVLVASIFIFLFYQSHFIFIDHEREYPWQEKTFYRIENPPGWLKPHSVLETPTYTYDQKLPLFGFPHKRYWNDINSYINSENILNNEEHGYITNEVKTISEWYMDAKYKADNGFYIVGVVEPLSFVLDYEHPQIGGKELVRQIKNEYGYIVVKIYKVSEKKY